jgi:hypothetical protein
VQARQLFTMTVMLTLPALPPGPRTEPVSVCVPLGNAVVGHESVTGPLEVVVCGVQTALASTLSE